MMRKTRNTGAKSGTAAGRSLPRFRLVLEYEGTRYRGWQIQKNARTVQGEVSSSLRKILEGDFDFQGAGRTDAGVHALAQTAHLAVSSPPSPREIHEGLNANLPHDINVLSLSRVSGDFHARHDAVARSYLYQISRRRTAFEKRHVWWVPRRLDAAVMAEAARGFTGMHDFRSFTDADPGEQSTKVLIEEIALREWGDLLLVRIRGSHFIWKLVRRLVGVLVEVGVGGVSPAAAARFLEEETDLPARVTAPPSGLFLERVFYRRDEDPGELLPAFVTSHFPFWKEGAAEACGGRRGRGEGDIMPGRGRGEEVTR